MNKVTNIIDISKHLKEIPKIGADNQLKDRLQKVAAVDYQQRSGNTIFL